MPAKLIVNETNLWPEDVELPIDTPCAVQGCRAQGLAATFSDRPRYIFLCDAHAILLGHCLGCGERTPDVGPDNFWCCKECAEDTVGIVNPDVFLADLIVRIAQIQAALS